MLSLNLVLAVGLVAALAPRLLQLRRRYDTLALSPIAGKPGADAGDEALQRTLSAWVADGAGTGATLLPWTSPRVPRPLTRLQLPAERETAVRHFGYRLAGYHQLDERSRIGGILYRIGVQLRPLAWFLPRRQDEPWDDAWLDEVDDARLSALQRWAPRRPTLIVLHQLPAARVEQVAAALEIAAGRTEQPIRLLVLETGRYAHQNG